MDSVKRALVGQGNAISARTTNSSVYQGIISRIATTTDDPLQTSAKVLASVLGKMDVDEERFGFSHNSFNTRLPTRELYPGIIIASVSPVTGLIEMILESSIQIVNLWGPSWCGKTHILQELLEHPKLRETYGDNISYMDVNETPNKEMFISMAVGLLSCGGGGEVEGIDVRIKANNRKLLILDNFPPKWERSIEELAFPVTGCKLLVVSGSKLSKFNAYGLENLCDEDEQMFHLYSPILNENPYNFVDIKNKLRKDDKAHEGFKPPGVFRWKKEYSCPTGMLDDVKAPNLIFDGGASTSSTAFVSNEDGSES